MSGYKTLRMWIYRHIFFNFAGKPKVQTTPPTRPPHRIRHRQQDRLWASFSSQRRRRKNEALARHFVPHATSLRLFLPFFQHPPHPSPLAFYCCFRHYNSVWTRGEGKKASSSRFLLFFNRPLRTGIEKGRKKSPPLPSSLEVVFVGAVKGCFGGGGGGGGGGGLVRLSTVARRFGCLGKGGEGIV